MSATVTAINIKAKNASFSLIERLQYEAFTEDFTLKGDGDQLQIVGASVSLTDEERVNAARNVKRIFSNIISQIIEFGTHDAQDALKIQTNLVRLKEKMANATQDSKKKTYIQKYFDKAIQKFDETIREFEIDFE